MLSRHDNLQILRFTQHLEGRIDFSDIYYFWIAFSTCAMLRAGAMMLAWSTMLWP